MRKIALAVLALALSTGCVSTESARKVKMPWWSGFIGGGGGSAFNGTLAAGVPLTLTGATSGTTAFNAAAVTTVSRTYSWPAGDGNASSVLTTDGSGALSWQTLQAGTGITLSRSGNTTTIASTGGGGGGGGSQTLAQTMALGNSTGAQDLVVTSGQVIQVDEIDGTPGTGLTLASGGTDNVTLTANGNGVYIGGGDNLIFNNGSALATTATKGFPVVPSCAGVPTGAAPEGSQVIDSVGHHQYARINGAWRQLDN